MYFCIRESRCWNKHRRAIVLGFEPASPFDVNAKQFAPRLAGHGILMRKPKNGIDTLALQMSITKSPTQSPLDDPSIYFALVQAQSPYRVDVHLSPEWVPLPRRWGSLKCMGNLILPRQTILPIDLGRDLEVLAALQEACANDYFIA